MVDLQQSLNKLAFRSICRVGFGVDPEGFGFGSTGELDFMEAFDYAVETCFRKLTSSVPLLWKVKRFFKVGSEKRFRDSVTAIYEFALRVIAEKEKENDDNRRQDLLSRFMVWSSSMEFTGGEKQRNKFLRKIVISFVLAGMDTTFTALTWFFWLIAGHPHVADSIHRELEREEFRLGYEELKRLDYLHAAISESMRLFPPVPHNSKLAIADDVWPDGTEVRKGWFADYSAYAVGREEKLWGEDCGEFKPERWLDGEGRFRAAGDQFKYLVFHCGQRACLGKEMAYVEMKAVAAAVMMEFEVVVVDGGGRPERVAEPPYVMSMMLRMRGELPVRVRRRRKEGGDWDRSVMDGKRRRRSEKSPPQVVEKQLILKF